MIPPPILQVHQVTRQFSRRVQPAVDGVSLSLQPGDLLALLGPSGCGKTTLLRLIAGFEPLQNGTIDIAEQRVAGAGQWVSPEQRGVGMVFQDYALFPHLTVRQNIEFGLGDRFEKPARSRHSKIRTSAFSLINRSALPQWGGRFKDILAIVRLEGMENRYPHQLSGGQQQRVALARALAPDPALILLDEPLSNLDVQVRLSLRQELRTILKMAGASAVFVTHDQEEALSIADQVAVMYQGCLEQVGTPEQLYQQPASQFVAEFVTQASLISAQRRGSVWHTEIGAIPFNQEHGEVDTVNLMIRQEDLRLTSDDTSPIVIGDRQFLGREYSYVLHLPSGRSIIARTPVSTYFAINTPVQIAIAAEKIQADPSP